MTDLICLCEVTGPLPLKLQCGQKLDDYFSVEIEKKRGSDPNEKERKTLNRKLRKQCLENNIYFKNGFQAAKSLADMTEQVLVRDYNQLVEFRENATDFGQIYLPDSYIPENPEFISEEDYENLSNLGHRSQELDGFAKKLASAKVEERLGRMLRRFFKDSTENVMIFHNFCFRTENGNQEVDFLLVNHSKMSISMFEVKKTLESNDHKGSVNSLTKVIEQLPRIKEMFERWFSSDIGPDWTYFSYIFTDKNVCVRCEKCTQYIATDFESVKTLLESQARKQAKNEQKSREEFVTMCKYLIYCISAVKLQTTGNLARMVRKAMGISGSLKNVILWCFLTPEQEKILTKKRVCFFGGWGSGKTTSMIEKAKLISRNGQKVLYIVFMTCKKDTLLVRYLRKVFEETPNNVVVKGITINFQSNFPFNEIEGFDHILIDEFVAEFVDDICSGSKLIPLFEGFMQLLTRRLHTLWVAPSNNMRLNSDQKTKRKQDFEDITKCDQEMTEEESLQEQPGTKERRQFFKSTLTDFFQEKSIEVLDLRYCLRSPKEIQNVLKQNVPSSDCDFNYTLSCQQSTTELINLASGKIKRIKTCEDLFALIKDDQAVLVIEEPLTFSNFHKSPNLTPNDSIIITALFEFMGVEIAQLPLFLFDDISNSDEEIKDWIFDQRKFSRSTLVATKYHVKGFEHQKVFYHHSATLNSSRATGMAIEYESLFPRTDCDCKVEVNEDLMNNELFLRVFEGCHVYFHGKHLISSDFEPRISQKKFFHPLAWMIEASIRANTEVVIKLQGESSSNFHVKTRKNSIKCLEFSFSCSGKCPFCPIWASARSIVSTACLACNSSAIDVACEWTISFIQILATQIRPHRKFVYVELKMENDTFHMEYFEEKDILKLSVSVIFIQCGGLAHFSDAALMHQKKMFQGNAKIIHTKEDFLNQLNDSSAIITDFEVLLSLTNEDFCNFPHNRLLIKLSK